MSDRPMLLDTYCKAGGTSRGYQLAGFHVTGVDIEPQPNYIGDAFYQADAVEFIREHGGNTVIVTEGYRHKDDFEKFPEEYAIKVVVHDAY